MANMTDIEEIVKTWAWTAFRKTGGKKYKKKKLDIQMDVNWTRVRFTSGAPDYMDSEMVDKPNSKVVFTSTFNNNTNEEQEHSFTTERTTVCSVTTSVSKGYTKGCHVALKIGLPEEVAAATAGFGRQVSMDSSTESTEEQSITWSVNSNIRVLPNHKTIAKMVVKEKEFTGKFRVEVQICGRVIVSFLDVSKNNAFIYSTEGDISEILKNEKDHTGYSVDEHTVKWKVEGNTKFRFGVEQQVHLHEEPLLTHVTSRCTRI